MGVDSNKLECRFRVMHACLSSFFVVGIRGRSCPTFRLLLHVHSRYGLDMLNAGGSALSFIKAFSYKAAAFDRCLSLGVSLWSPCFRTAPINKWVSARRRKDFGNCKTSLES